MINKRTIGPGELSLDDGSVKPRPDFSAPPLQAAQKEEAMRMQHMHQQMMQAAAMRIQGRRGFVMQTMVDLVKVSNVEYTTESAYDKACEIVSFFEDMKQAPWDPVSEVEIKAEIDKNPELRNMATGPGK